MLLLNSEKVEGSIVWSKWRKCHGDKNTTAVFASVVYTKT